jgi:O-antigen/teichoic acid export membrane protein/2-polyprenyl-3-methyl-5-hydroxy-6-metoxy-1,4-benzoquinol methylase
MDEGAQTAEYVRLARDGAVNYGGQLAAALIGFVVVPVLLHHLGAESYGVFVVALTCAALAGFLDLGLGSSVTREVAATVPDRERFLQSAGGAFTAFGAAGALLIAVLGPISHGLGLAPGIGDTALVFGFVGTAFFGDQLTLYSTAVLGGLRRFDLVNAMLVGSVASRATGTLALLFAGAGVAAVAAWYALSAWLWALVNAFVLRRISKPCAFRPRVPEADVLRPRVGFGIGSTGIMAALGSIWNVGTLGVATVDGAAASALYQVSQRFPLALMALPDRVSVTLFPAASEQARSSGGGAAARLIGNGTRLLGVVLLPVAIVLFATADDLLRAWLGSIPPDGGLILRLTTLAVVAQALGASALQVVWGRGEVRSLAVALLTVAAMAVAATAALALTMGPAGAALGLATAAVVSTATVLALAVRIIGWSVIAELRRAGVDLVWPGLACAVAAGALTELEVGDGWARVFAVGGASVGAYLATFVLLGRGDQEREIATALVRTQRSMRKRFTTGLRRRARRHRGLRNAAHLTRALYETVADTPLRNRSAALAAYEQGVDPWGYETEWGRRHLELADGLLAVASSSGPIRRALDIGCGEGWMTERLVAHCAEILAVDISPVALERAKRRCAAAGPQVRFERWDVLDGKPLGEFDLVLAAGVLEVFRRPRAMRRARDGILEAVAPGGHVLVTTTKQNPIVEGARWSAALIRGSGQIDRFLRASGRVELRAQAESDTHTLTLYRLARPTG